MSSETPVQKEHRVLIGMIRKYFKNRDLLKESTFEGMERAASKIAGTEY